MPACIIVIFQEWAKCKISYCCFRKICIQIYVSAVRMQLGFDENLTYHIICINKSFTMISEFTVLSANVVALVCCYLLTFLKFDHKNTLPFFINLDSSYLVGVQFQIYFPSVRLKLRQLLLLTKCSFKILLKKSICTKTDHLIKLTNHLKS